MSDMLIILICFIIFTLITTSIYTYTKGKQITLSKIKLQFIIGGVLIFIGKEHRATNIKPLSRKTSITMMLTIFIGMCTFYTFFVPKTIEFIPKFINYITGTTLDAPQPIAVPIPLLFKFIDFVPYILIAITIAVAIHELMHAFVALREGVPIKSWGIGILFLLPLAFVELDENSFVTATTKTKLNIVSAGIFGNAIASVIAIITLLALINIATTMFGNITQIVTIDAIDCSICNTSICPAMTSGLDVNKIIKSINQTAICSVKDVVNILSNASIGSNLTITICDYSNICRDVALTLSPHKKNPNMPCIGIKFNTILAFIRDSHIYRILWLEKALIALNTIFAINFSLFMINAIPLFVTDGSLFLKHLPIKHVVLNKLFSARILDLINVVIIILAIIFSSYIILLG